MFASQAALVIANARKYREEQRARADLEALIDTSPVGVIVFDAKTGVPIFFNLETRRILEELRMPGGSVEQLLEVLTFQRADGREISVVVASCCCCDTRSCTGTVTYRFGDHGLDWPPTFHCADGIEVGRPNGRLARPA